MFLLPRAPFGRPLLPTLSFRFCLSFIAMDASSPSPEASGPPSADPDALSLPSSSNLPSDPLAPHPVPESVPHHHPLDGQHPDHGFQRQEMYKGTLVGTVQFHERHVFLCYKDPSSWPSHVEGPEFDRLPSLLAAALRARKNEMPRKTRLTICEGREGSDSLNGDLLIFPDMVFYKGLSSSDVDTVVDEVLIQGKEWLPGMPERLTGAHVFICSHASRDARCGACGPVLIQSFKEKIVAHGLEGQVSVRACSHVGGHKYAGNVIIYNMSQNGQVTGHWYGYVTPEDVPVLLEDHIFQGKIVDRLWRGQMGLTEDEQTQAQQSRLLSDSADQSLQNGCCCVAVQENINGLQDVKRTMRCCQETGQDDKQQAGKSGKNSDEKENLQKCKFSSGWCHVSSWFDAWEREDTIAAVAIVGVAAAVAAVYHLYRTSSSN